MSQALRNILEGTLRCVNNRFTYCLEGDDPRTGATVHIACIGNTTDDPYMEGYDPNGDPEVEEAYGIRLVSAPQPAPAPAPPDRQRPSPAGAITINRLVESFSHGHGRIIEIGTMPSYFVVKFSRRELIYPTDQPTGLRFFNDDETAYLI